jgi:hypothetical protein
MHTGVCTYSSYPRASKSPAIIICKRSLEVMPAIIDMPRGAIAGGATPNKHETEEIVKIQDGSG